MTTKVRTGMLDADVVTTAALATFRSIFVGIVETFPFLPSDDCWIPCYGQTLLVSDYPLLASRLGSTYGGDGVVDFALPDYRGRVPAGADNMGGVAANRLTTAGSGVDGGTLGAVGGAQTHTLTVGQLAAHGHVLAINSGGAHTHQNRGSTANSISSGGSANYATPRMDPLDVTPNSVVLSGGAHSHDGTANDTGGGQAHNNVQPTIVQHVCILAF